MHRMERTFPYSRGSEFLADRSAQSPCGAGQDPCASAARKRRAPPGQEPQARGQPLRGKRCRPSSRFAGRWPRGFRRRARNRSATRATREGEPAAPARVAWRVRTERLCSRGRSSPSQVRDASHPRAGQNCACAKAGDAYCPRSQCRSDATSTTAVAPIRAKAPNGSSKNTRKTRPPGLRSSARLTSSAYIKAGASTKT